MHDYSSHNHSIATLVKKTCVIENYFLPGILTFGMDGMLAGELNPSHPVGIGTITIS